MYTESETDMKKILSFLVGMMLLMGVCMGVSGEETLVLHPVEGVIRPGQAILIEYEAPRDGTASLTLRAAPEDTEALSVVAQTFEIYKGHGGLWWNGTYNGVPAPDGDAYLVLECEGEIAYVPVTVGNVHPMVLRAETSVSVLHPGESLSVKAYLTCSGTLTLLAQHENGETDSVSVQTEEGEGGLEWTPEGLTDGTVAISLMLTDASGDTSEPFRSVVALEGFPEADIPAVEADSGNEKAEDETVDAEETVQEEDRAEPVLSGDNDQRQYTPNWTSPYYGTDTSLNYWTLPMDITDEEAVWQVLTSPITVVDTGKDKSERTQIVIRKEPSLESDGVGVVTCVSQGVHVLETLDSGWTKIECYSSSFHNSKIKAWNFLVQGYVETKYIKTVKPNQELGFVVDKLTQRLYVFKDGHLFSTLLVSTGLSNARQPYNETRSGEFLLLNPAVGEFRSDNLYCSMAIRFDNGDLLHEVPHTLNRDGSNNYSNTEPKLGERASHGCIRVQRKKTPEGVNMRWIWEHRTNNMRILIWEDWQGRQIPYPDDDSLVYYNPNGGQMYHSGPTCNSASGKTFEAFPYGELDSETYAKLERCDYCTPPLRKAEIDAINELHAPGGDHDPVLTEARRKLGLLDE